MSYQNQRELTNSMIELLQRGTGKLVGDAKAPVQGAGVSDEDFFPYCIVYSIPGVVFDGSLRDPFEDASVTYQVTSVGQTREQCEWMVDRVRLVMLARTTAGVWQVPVVSPAGTRVNGRLPLDGFSGGVDQEGDPPHEVYSCPDRYVLQITPDFS